MAIVLIEMRKNKGGSAFVEDQIWNLANLRCLQNIQEHMLSG